jgi:outer membrane beta-barrel protein
MIRFGLALIALTLTACVANVAKAERIDLKKDLDTLGGNEAIVERARMMSPDQKVRVVQNRLVDRHMRLELGANYGLVAGGDSYINTQNLGANLDFHINPHWSVGGRFSKSFNSLTSQGQQVFDYASQQQSSGNLNYRVPAIDYPLQTLLGVVSWYPIYGKLNLFDAAVVHFDLYTLAGYGEKWLQSGQTNALTAGGGVGIWLSQYVAMRLEGRWENYSDQVYTGARNENTGVFTTSLGILL